MNIIEAVKQARGLKTTFGRCSPQQYMVTEQGQIFVRIGFKWSEETYFSVSDFLADDWVIDDTIRRSKQEILDIIDDEISWFTTDDVTPRVLARIAEKL